MTTLLLPPSHWRAAAGAVTAEFRVPSTGGFAILAEGWPDPGAARLLPSTGAPTAFRPLGDAAFLAGALALEGEDALVHLHLDVLRVHARDVGEDDEAVGFLADVHARRPLAGHHVGRIGAGLAEEALEHLAELILQVAAGNGVVADDGHGGLLARESRGGTRGDDREIGAAGRVSSAATRRQRAGG